MRRTALALLLLAPSVPLASSCSSATDPFPPSSGAEGGAAGTPVTGGAGGTSHPDGGSGNPQTGGSSTGGSSTGGSDTGGSAGTAGAGGSSAFVDCAGTPPDCSSIGPDQDRQYYGCCDGAVVYWCDDQSGTWELHSLDCAASGASCDYVSSYESMYCAAPPVDTGDGPGAGPGPDCPSLPALECTGGGSYCSQVVPFDPDTGDGYIDYPENGETSSNQYRSYLRRDLMMLIKYATAKVACKAAGWTSGNGKPLGLIDMSEANGDIPGTSIGQPGHPAGTHTGGKDIDVAYYQTADMPDNRARPVCEHTLNGQEQYHCVSAPTTLDVWRAAAFLGFLFEHPALRVVGADGQAGPLLDGALDKLCQDGWLTNYACSHRKLTYEVTDQGYGWFYFHHHHMHVSLQPPAYATSLDAGSCLVPGCKPAPLDSFLSEFGLRGPSRSVHHRRPAALTTP